MMGLFDTVSVAMEFHSCPTCHVAYGIPQTMGDARREDGNTFYCPNGHTVSYRKSEVQKLRDELAKKTHEIDQVKASRDRYSAWLANAQKEHDATRRRLTSTKGVVTRIKSRVRKGACPCCSETFADLRAHMDEQHPGYAGEASADG